MRRLRSFIRAIELGSLAGIVAVPGDADPWYPKGPAGTSTGSSVPLRTRNSRGTRATVPLLRADRDRPRVEAGPGVGRCADRQPEPPGQALGRLGRPAGHDQSGADRVDAPLHRDATDPVGDRAQLDRGGRDRADRARQVGDRDRDLAQLVERDQAQGDRLVLAGERLGPEPVRLLGLKGRVIGEDVLHRVAMEEDVAPAAFVDGRPQGVAGGSVQDALEVVVEIEPPPRGHVVEERPAPRLLGRGEDHDGRDGAGPVLAVEVDVELAVADLHLVVFSWK